MEKLKKRWKIKNNWSILAILLVFSINGTFATYISKPLTELLGISQETHGWLYWIIKIPLIFIVYQITLPIVGWFFGQFQFFYNMEKKMLKRIGLGFLFKK